MMKREFQKKRLLTSIEITDTHLKCLEIKYFKGQPVVVGCDIKEIEGEEDAAGKLSLILKGRKKNVGVNLIIPRHEAIMKYLRLPSHDPEELKRMIPLHLVSELPLSLEEIIYDHTILRKESDGYAGLLVFAIPKETCTRYASLLKHAGLNLEHLNISTSGLAGWLDYQTNKKEIDCPGVLMLVNIDATRSEVCFFKEGRLLYSRDVSAGVRTICELEPSENGHRGVDKFLIKIGQCLNVCREGFIDKPEKILIMPQILEIVQVKSRMESAWNIPVEVKNGYENILFRRGFDMRSIKNQEFVSLSALLGQMSLKDEIDFTPPQVKEERHRLTRRKEWVRLGSLALTASLLVLSIMGMNVQKKVLSLKMFEERSSVSQVERQKALKKIQMVKLLDDKKKSNVSIAQLMAELVEDAGEGVSFRSFTMEEKGKVTIEGYASGSVQVNDFQQKLLNSPAFNQVNLEFTTQRNIYNREVTEFKITFLIKAKGVLQ